MIILTSSDASRATLPHFLLGSLLLRLQPLHEDFRSP
jgi:hypothetical protein